MWIAEFDQNGVQFWRSDVTGATTYAANPGSEQAPNLIPAPVAGSRPVDTRGATGPLESPPGGPGGGIGIPPIFGGPGGGSGANLTAIPYAGTIREWPPGQMPSDLQPLLFRAPSSGYSVAALIGLPDGNQTIINAPLNYAGGTDAFWKAVETTVSQAALIAFVIAAAGLIGGQKYQQTGTGGATGSQEGSGEGPITVNVTDVSNVTAGVLNGVSLAVGAAISAAGAQANQTAVQTANQVTGALSTVSNVLEQGVSAFTTAIPTAIGGILSQVFNPVSIIQASLNQNVTDLGGLVNGITNDIVSPLGKAVQTAVASIGAVAATIGKNVSDLLSGLSPILFGFVSSLPDAVNNVEKVLERIGVIFTKVKDSIHFETIDLDLKRLGDEIAGLAKGPIDTVFRPIDLISDKCDVSTFDQEIDNSGKSIADAPTWEKWLGKIGMYVFLQAARLLATVEHVKEVGAESINRDCQITKLNVETVISLWRRGILNAESAKDELIAQGFSPSRQKALYDGSAFLESPATALDYWYRRISSADDLRGILLSNGFSSQQVDAFKAASVQLGAPSDVIHGWLNGTLTEDEVNTTLRANRYDDAQITLLKSLARRAPFTTEILEGENVRSVLGAFTLPQLLGIGTDWDTVPQWFSDAGRAEGLSDQAIQERWWAHWNIPSPDIAIQQYFRGIRTMSEVRAIMARYYIPATLQQDLISIARPLIPFRSVPTMLANGILSDDGARSLLEKHGFDSGAIDSLMALAKLSKPKASTAAAQNAHAASIAVSRTLFEDGAITEDQFREILKEHGYVQSAIDSEIQVAQLQEAAKQRKQAGVDIINEFQAGLLSIDQARQQIAQLNYTIAEQARYLKQLKTAKTALSKIPTEPDLDKMLQRSIITQDVYVSSLEALGYSSDWANRFLALRTAPTTPAPTPTAPAPATPGG